jgi:hypothetical protein
MDRRYISRLAAAATVGLGALYVAVPARTDLLLAAAAGTLFAGAAGVAGYQLVAGAARASPSSGVRVFLAIMTAKVVAFPAFLLIIAFSTSLNLAALAAGLAGATLVAEILAIQGLRQIEAERGPADTRELRGQDGAGAGNESKRNEE